MAAFSKPAALTSQIKSFHLFQNVEAAWKKLRLKIECLVLFFMVPIALYWFRHMLAFKLAPVLLLSAFICLIYLFSDKTFDRSVLWKMPDLSTHMQHILITLMGISLFLGLFTYLLYENLFLVFPINRPNAALIFVLLYPLLGALPQEIIFKSFFFHRYGDIFPGQVSLVVLNGLSFGLFHLWYANMIAPVFSIFAGMILGYRYLKTQSLLITSIEHSIMGIFLYLIGLGWFFYSGSIQ
ncbi:MAG: CPBP family intramembrane glutamic endopeptidase [Desulfotignum sp.]